MPNSPNKLIITSFPFLLNKDFSPKYHLFDSVLLCRIVSISTEQDLFINWDFGPKYRSKYRNKKEVAKQRVYLRHIHSKKEEIEHMT